MHSDWVRQGDRIFLAKQDDFMQLIALATSEEAADAIVSALQLCEALEEEAHGREETDWVPSAKRYAAARRGERWAIDEERAILDQIVEGGGRSS